MNHTYYAPADIEVYISGKGIVAREQSVVGGVSSFRQGKIVDFEGAVQVFRQCLEKAFGRSLIKPEVVVCHPSDYSLVDEKACVEAMMLAGAKGVYMYPGDDVEYFLAHIPEEIPMRKVKGVIVITKEEPLEYIRETAREALDFAKKYGVSKEQFIEIIKES